MTKRKTDNKTGVELAKELLLDHKAKNVAIINLKPLENSVCDYFIVTHGTSDRHVQGLAENLVEGMEEKQDLSPWHIEGMQNKEWILIDYADIVVHIFREEIRNFYNIEELWADAEITYYDEDTNNNI
ncbi:MAG: ribosome silencing factor [Bacteroidales bacterium]|nr:ribosome silencing factor [Bacteroidales bacterium]